MNIFKYFVISFLLFLMFSCSQRGNESVSSITTNAQPLSVIDTVFSEKNQMNDFVKSKRVFSVIKHETSQDIYEENILSNEGNGSLHELYRELDKKPERFELNTQKDTVISTTSGTFFTVQANSFTTNGRLETGAVVLEVKEYVTKGDFLLANLTTSSNGKMLESGGMFHLNATNKVGEKCILAKGKTIQMKVPIQGDGYDDMGLFYGQNNAHGQVNWHLDSKNKVTKRQKGRKNKLLSKSMESLRIITLQNKVSVYEVISGKMVYSDSVDYRKDYFSTGSTESIKTMAVDFTLNGNGEVTKQEILNNSKRIKTNIFFCQWKKKFFSIISTSKFGRIISESSCCQKVKFNKEYFFDISISNSQNVGSFHVVPNYFSKATFPKDKNQDAFRLKMNKIYVYSDSSYRNSEEMKTERIAQKLKDSTSNLSASEIGYYTVATSQLEFINIDRFYHEKGRKVEMFVMDSKGADLKLIFDRINSVLSPNTGSNAFIQIPIDEPVTLFALKMKGKIPYMALKKMTTREGAVNDLEYTPTTVEDIKNQFANL